MQYAMQKKETNKAPKDGQFLKQSWLFLFRNVGAVSNIPAPYVQADIPVSLGVMSMNLGHRAWLLWAFSIRNGQ